MNINLWEDEAIDFIERFKKFVWKVDIYLKNKDINSRKEDKDKLEALLEKLKKVKLKEEEFTFDDLGQFEEIVGNLISKYDIRKKWTNELINLSNKYKESRK